MVSKKNFWDMTKEEQEAQLGKAIKEEIAKHHAAGRPTVHGDDKGVFWLYPDGTKEYVKLYDPPVINKHALVNQFGEMDRI